MRGKFIGLALSMLLFSAAFPGSRTGTGVVSRRHQGMRSHVSDRNHGRLHENLVTMEMFAIRGGKIRHVEVFPFVTLPYGLGNGWTPGSGR
jgi:hypothetical protein